MLDVQHVDRFIILQKEDHFVESCIKKFNPFKSYGGLFMIPKFFPMRVDSLELCIGLGQKCNIL